MNGTQAYPSPESLRLLSEIVRNTARTRRLSPEDADDFMQSVHLRLLERDYDVLRQFTGHSSLRTFLTVVVTRMLLDWRNAMWGKWRVSAAARRLGDAAVALERLIHRDGFTTDEAIEILKATRHAPPAGELRVLADAIPPRMRRRFVSDEELPETLGAPFDDPVEADQRQRAGDQAHRMLRSAVKRLTPEDQELIRLRYDQGYSVQTISRTLRTQPKTLYRRFERVRRSLRRSLEEAGYRPDGQPSSTAGSGSTRGARSTITRRTMTASETSATTPAMNTTRMLRAPTRPLSTGLTAEPLSEALVRNPKLAPCTCGGITAPAAAKAAVKAVPSERPMPAIAGTSSHNVVLKAKSASAADPVSVAAAITARALIRCSSVAASW